MVVEKGMTWAYYPVYQFKFRTQFIGWSLEYLVEVELDGKIKEFWAKGQRLESLFNMRPDDLEVLDKLSKITDFIEGNQFTDTNI